MPHDEIESVALFVIVPEFVSVTWIAVVDELAVAACAGLCEAACDSDATLDTIALRDIVGDNEGDFDGGDEVLKVCDAFDEEDRVSE